MKKWKDMSAGMNALLVAICELAVGVLLLIDPVGFTGGIVIGMGILLAIGGLISVVGYFRMSPAEAAKQRSLAKGLCLSAAGLFCMLRPGWFIDTFTVLSMLYGAAILTLGFMRVQWTVDELRCKSGKWRWAAASAVLALAVALIILCDPFASTAVLWIFTGISLITEAALDIAAMLMGRKKSG